jgi:hypothetical protein
MIKSNTIHDDLNIPYITDEIKKGANRYRNRISDHENQLIDDLSNPHPNARRLKKNWPEKTYHIKWMSTAVGQLPHTRRKLVSHLLITFFTIK